MLSSCLRFTGFLCPCAPSHTVIFSATHLPPTLSALLSPCGLVSLRQSVDLDDRAGLNSVYESHDEGWWGPEALPTELRAWACCGNWGMVVFSYRGGIYSYN